MFLDRLLSVSENEGKESRGEGDQESSQVKCKLVFGLRGVDSALPTKLLVLDC